MKPIEQLLQLSKNPYYKFSAEEQERLNVFLAKPQDSPSKKSPRKSSKKSSYKTRVTVRNIVDKVDTYAPDASTVAQNQL